MGEIVEVIKLEVIADSSITFLTPAGCLRDVGGDAVRAVGNARPAGGGFGVK